VSAGCLASLGIAYRRVGQGPRHVLLLHALTGGPDAADGPTTKGWWGPLFHPGGALDETGCTTWCPNLPWSCYGTAWPKESRPSVRAQASLLADWLEAEDLSFDLLLGGSLGGMVALELALIAPQRFRTLGVIGCGGRADAWLWGANAVQRAILDNRCLTDGDAIALARRAAMLTFRTPEGLGQRFATGEAIRAGWTITARPWRRASPGGATGPSWRPWMAMTWGGSAAASKAPSSVWRRRCTCWGCGRINCFPRPRWRNWGPPPEPQDALEASPGWTDLTATTRS